MTDVTSPSLAPAGMRVAVALKAVVPETAELTPGEFALLSEWLDTIADRAR